MAMPRPICLMLMSLAAAAASLGAPAQPSMAADAARPACGMGTGKPATGSPIVLGAIVGKTGPDDFSSSGAAATAYFKCVNQNGGINGRRIDYVVVDDQWNPEVAAQVASKLVRDLKVVALVGNTSFVECGANARMYAEQGVMVIAGTGVPRECFTSRNYVPVNSGPRVSSTIAMMYAAQVYKSQRVVCIVPDIPSLGRWACEGPKAWGSTHGVQVDTIAIDPDTADATSILLQAAAKKPDTIILNVSKGLLVPLLAAAEQQDLGKKIHFLSSAPAYDLSIPKTIGAYWSDRFAVNLEFQPLDSRGVDNINWLAVMAAYGSPSDPRDTFSQAGYLAARLVTETLLKMNPASIDRASVTEALRKVANFRSDILCKPFYVGAGQRHNANNAGPMVMMHGQGFSAVPGGCLSAEDPELADVRADERKMGLQ